MSRAQNLVPQPESEVASTVLTISSTQTLVLNPDTQLVEVQSKNGDAFVNFTINGVLTTATTSNNGFIARVNDGQVRHYIIGMRSSLSIAANNTSTEVTVIEYRVS